MCNHSLTSHTFKVSKETATQPCVDSYKQLDTELQILPTRQNFYRQTGRTCWDELTDPSARLVGWNDAKKWTESKHHQMLQFQL